MRIKNIVRNFVWDNLKNVRGTRTNKKYIAFAVDDYGNVRVDSKVARSEMNNKGLRIHNIFDAYDSLETAQDLEMLFEVLHSVKDSNGHPAIFTPFALPCNLNFEHIIESNFDSFQIETLPETYKKLDQSKYSKTWELWKEGINGGYFVPAFHGREHLNLKLFIEKLKCKDRDLVISIYNRSLSSITSDRYPTISYTAAFDFWHISDNYELENIIESGVNYFEKVFGFKTSHFNAPGGRENIILHRKLADVGIRFIDSPIIKREHQGEGKYLTRFNYLGKNTKYGQKICVRNCVFEPASNKTDSINLVLKQIERAFLWNKPAIISSHRVNFCGNISEENRKNSLVELSTLLKMIVRKWPDVEFINSSKLCEIIFNSNESL